MVLKKKKKIDTYNITQLDVKCYIKTSIKFSIEASAFWRIACLYMYILKKKKKIHACHRKSNIYIYIFLSSRSKSKNNIIIIWRVCYYYWKY